MITFVTGRQEESVRNPQLSLTLYGSISNLLRGRRQRLSATFCHGSGPDLLRAGRMLRGRMRNYPQSGAGVCATSEARSRWTREGRA